MARSLDDVVLVERHLFGLMDLDVARCPSPWPQGSMPLNLTVWAQVNRLDVRSVGEDHVAAVRLEGWDSAPAAPGGDWDDHEEVRLPLTSGEVRLWTLTDGPSPHAPKRQRRDVGAVVDTTMIRIGRVNGEFQPQVHLPDGFNHVSGGSKASGNTVSVDPSDCSICRCSIP